MKPALGVSPDAMLIFLKQAAFETFWTAACVGKVLGLFGHADYE
jgi:hypothetical protein